MNLLAPISLKMLGYAALGLGALTVVAYILKMRRRRFEVPFSSLWHRVLREKETTTLWKHLRRFLSLLLALAILALFLFSATEPRLGAPDADARSVVIILDTSASMKTRDEGSDGTTPRIVVAKESVLELLSAMGSGDRAMVMRMDGQTTPLSGFEEDKSLLKKIVSDVEPTDTPANLRRALSAAADALRERERPLIIIVGDGAYPAEVLDDVVWAASEQIVDEEPDPNARKRLTRIDLGGIDVRYMPVGKKGQNVGIVAFNVRRYIANKTSYEVFIEVKNFGDEPTQRKLVLYSGESAVDVQELALKPGETVRKIYRDRSGAEDTHLEASIQLEGSADKHDIFPLDDHAFALLPERKRQVVLLVTEDNLYLEGAMLVYDNIVVDKMVPAEYEAAAAALELPKYDAVVFDDHTPRALPPEPTHLLYFNPSGEHSPFDIVSSLANPQVTEVNADHPVMRWISMSDVHFDATSVFAVGRTAQVLARSVRSPIVVAKKDGRRKVIAFGFSLGGSDLMLRVAFPLLLVNSLDWFAGDDADLLTTYATGRRVKVPVDVDLGVTDVAVLTPGGQRTRAPVSDGRATFYANEVGIHQIQPLEGGVMAGNLELAANLENPEESDIAPSTELRMGSALLEAPEGFAVTRRQSLWLYAALLALLLLCIEWLTYNRRITV